MSAKKKKTKSKCTNSNALSNHPFAESCLQYGVRILAVIAKPLTVIKKDTEYKRPPTKAEFYCLSVARATCQVLAICQQLEHSTLYFSAFSPSEKMKKAGISRQTHLLYCIENYIVRTQSMYDRLLRLIDSAFELYNPSHIISYEVVVNNLHIKHSSIPKKLKELRKVIKPYYYDRNLIIHESQYLEDDLRRLEFYTTFSSKGGPYEGERNLSKEAQHLANQIVKNKTKEFTKINRDSFAIIGEIFNSLNKEYESKRKILEDIHGKSELA